MSSGLSRKTAQRTLARAAMEGLLSGAALLACASGKGTVVSAPMETAPPSSPSAAPRAAPHTPHTPLAIEAPVPKDCCAGKNACKGTSGCRRPSAACSGASACKGKNDCKGQGTACDSFDEDP